LVKKEAVVLIGAFRSEVKRADDYDMWLRLSANNIFQYIPQVMVKYRIMDDQISSNKEGRFLANKDIMKNFNKTYPNALSQRQKLRGWSSFHLRQSFHYLKESNYLSSFNHVTKSLLFYPFWLGPWKILLKLITKLILKK
jgi:hypothetical protein